jgi:hypothetical protein
MGSVLKESTEVGVFETWDFDNGRLILLLCSLSSLHSIIFSINFSYEYCISLRNDEVFLNVFEGQLLHHRGLFCFFLIHTGFDIRVPISPLSMSCVASRFCILLALSSSLSSPSLALCFLRILVTAAPVLSFTKEVFDIVLFMTIGAMLALVRRSICCRTCWQ